MIVGTAGHVDHGKTALIRGLTGIATDRLKEEQTRGLTIEPGYAYPTPPPGSEGAVLGFIDVPGHERFIANMLAGAAGIDAMLLVVAADDGIMPQSVEHLRILELLGVERAWVALTKCDRVDAARVQQVRVEITAWLAQTRFAGAPLFAVSNLSGAGQAALGAALWSAPLSSRARGWWSPALSAAVRCSRAIACACCRAGPARGYARCGHRIARSGWPGAASAARSI